MPVSDLLVLKYDDIRLSQLIAIAERANLLRNGFNLVTTFRELLSRDWELRKLYDNLIESEGMEETLQAVVGYLLRNYNEYFPQQLCPGLTHRDEYLSDLVQFLGTVDA